MEVSWHSVDFVTGLRGPRVEVQATPALSRVIGEASTATVSVRCYDAERDAGAWLNEPTTAGAVPGWETGTAPGRSMLVACDEYDQPVWGGFVVERVRSNDEWVQVALATPEAYLERRFVGDRVFTDTDQATIARELLEYAQLDADVYDAPASGVKRDRTYVGSEDKTVYSALTELMGVANGPEFTCELRWADADHARLERVWVVRNRIGTRSTAVFETPGSVTGFSFVESYASEYGANDVMAYSSGEGKARPESDHAVDIAAGWPRYELRFTPSTSIKNKSRLNSHAQTRLDETRDGLAEWSFESSLSFGPVPGRDFRLGDDAQLVVTAPGFPAMVGPNGDVVPGHVSWQRVVGYTIDVGADRLQPLTVEA